MKLCLITSLLLAGLISCGQVQWSKSSNWTIYDIQVRDMVRVPIDTLSSLDSASLNMDTIESYMATVELLHPNGPVAWMGGYIATCKIDGMHRKIELSNYGGFFYDERTNSFYRVSKDKIDSWVDYLQNSYLALVKRKSRL